ncbi:hypothetical protein BTE77_31420 [Ensifer adhaerens]|nr:hypothetical protein BTE77_31420 [Ensifer adhaerens]
MSPGDLTSLARCHELTWPFLGLACVGASGVDELSSSVSVDTFGLALTYRLLALELLSQLIAAGHQIDLGEVQDTVQGQIEREIGSLNALSTATATTFRESALRYLHQFVAAAEDSSRLEGCLH